jgi:glycosyltransferase involved in cell wall biosynthesis
VTPRALLVTRPDASSKYGGDTRLASATLAALREAGIAADLIEAESPDPGGYDVAHIFNIGDAAVCARQMDACEAKAVPIVLSPVWLDVSEMLGRGRAFERTLMRGRDASAVEKRLCRIRQAEIDRLMGWRERIRLGRRMRAQSDLLRRARVLLPNSADEAKDCMVRLGVRDVPMFVVPIAADLEPASAWKQERAGIALVGRIETRKNQLTALFGLRAGDMPIDVIGTPSDPELVEACRRWCPRARLHGHLPRREMLETLGRAAVHVMASWCETAGIASLEAAAAGAQLVVGDRGAEFEYFGENAEYADPADPESIRAAVHRALARPPRRAGDSLDVRIRRNTWRDAARLTLSAYELALRPRNSG